jgi:hypothetical protein
MTLATTGVLLILIAGLWWVLLTGLFRRAW